MTKMINRPWKNWVSDLRFTWSLVVLLSVLPGVLYGSVVISTMMLLGAVFLGLPIALFALLLSKDPEWRVGLCRRVAVLAVVPAMMVTVILQADKLTPEKAAPIAKAIESFKRETGSYPDSLAIISPKYLSTLPAVRVAVIQPEIIYRVREGSPYFAIPSAAGDAYSIYEYNFESRVWIHHL